MLEEYFEERFKDCWTQLEKYQPADEKIESYYNTLKFFDPGLVGRTFAYWKKFGTRKDGFPTGPEFVKKLNEFKISDADKKKKILGIPEHILKMTDAECDADCELLSGFFEAYPAPDYPVGATVEQLQKIDRDYDNRMRTAGINPAEMMNPKVAAGIVKDSMSALPDLRSPGMRGGGWKKSVEIYNLNQSQADMKTIRQMARQALS